MIRPWSRIIEIFKLVLFASAILWTSFWKFWLNTLIRYKSNAIPGIYEQYEDAENGIYYRRTAFVRGRPDMAYFPKGEEDPDFVPRRPEYTYRTELIRNVDDFNTINQTSPEMNSFVNLILNQVQTVRFSTILV